MITSLSSEQLVRYLVRQLENTFPDDQPVDVHRVVPRAMERLERCFSRAKLPGYRRAGVVNFNHLHSDQYATFIYLASNEAWKLGDLSLAAKLFGLNKALNGFMCMYDTLLPEMFLVIHTVGMMLGKASYSNYFVAAHHCTVGAHRDRTPHFGEGVMIFGGASVVGASDVGAYSSIAAQAMVIDAQVPPASVVAGAPPTPIVKPARRNLIQEYYFEI